MNPGDTTLACAAASICVLAVVVSDKRTWSEPPQHQYNVPRADWDMIRSQQVFSVGWFRRHIRCTRDAFEEICRSVSSSWATVLPPLGSNAEVGISTRVAIAMNYLAHGGSMYKAAELVGHGKTIAVTSIHQVLAVLETWVERTITPPTRASDWELICSEFEHVSGMPGVVGAVDGCLIRVKRFADYDGWYCNRGYPAFNMMGVVDHRQRFMAYSLRNGAQNDKSVFNRSIFAREMLDTFPPGTHLVRDAGYQLLTNVLTPYPILAEMTRANRWYNLVHSRTRIAVDQSFGRPKGKFRVFKSDLSLQTPTDMALIIKGCLVLHNWIIDLDGTPALTPVAIEDWMEIDRAWWATEEVAGHEKPARDKRDAIRDYLFACRVEQFLQV